jgi:hypothetical protein
MNPVYHDIRTYVRIIERMCGRFWPEVKLGRARPMGSAVRIVKPRARCGEGSGDEARGRSDAGRDNKPIPTGLSARSVRPVAGRLAWPIGATARRDRAAQPRGATERRRRRSVAYDCNAHPDLNRDLQREMNSGIEAAWMDPRRPSHSGARAARGGHGSQHPRPHTPHLAPHSIPRYARNSVPLRHAPLTWRCSQ